MSQALDVAAGADYQGPWDLVGPQTDGTYNAPATAQPVNQPWDTPGGGTTDYGSNVLDILKFGVGAWSADRQQTKILDYKRVEATNGGAYQQGQPAAMPNRNGAQSMLIPLLLVVGLVFLLKS